MTAADPAGDAAHPAPLAAARSLLARIEPRSWADVGVLTALSLIGVIGLAPAFGFGSFVAAAIGGLVVGALVAVAGALARLPLLTTVAIGIGAYFVTGGAIAVPGQTLAGVLPSLDSLASLARGAVFGWADLLTLQAPVEAPPSVAVVPFVAGWAVSLVTCLLALRWLPRRPRSTLRSAVLLAGPVVLFAAGVLLGTGQPFLAAARGIAFAGIALVWLGWRRRSGMRIPVSVVGGVIRRRLIGTGVVLVGAVLVGVLAGSALTPPVDSRFVLRDAVTPPFDPLDYASPLAGFRHYTKTLEKTKLFTVRGLQRGETIRLATMDTYDGIVWSVTGPDQQTGGSGSFELLGRTIPTPPLFTGGGTDRVSVTIDGYDDVWLPNAGYTTTLDFDAHRGQDPRDTVRVNTSTGTIAVTSGVSRGLDYTLGIDRQSIPGDRLLRRVAPARIDMPQVSHVPDVVAAKADEYAGSATSALQKLRNIERSLKTFGYLSHGRASDPVPSRAGEGADRMSDLFSQSPMVGDQEQYASAFALMARHLGYPARVVMGFAPKVSEGQTSTTVTGGDVTAWTEVAFQGVGWVPFFPTPDKTDAPKEQTVKPKLEPQPQVRQPPRTNQKADDLLTPVKTKDRADRKEHRAFVLPVWVWVAGGILVLLILAVTVPMLVIGLLKRRRRRRRRAARDPDLRGAGPWEDLTDRYAELGFDLPERSTRRIQAQALDRQTADQGLKGPAGGLVPLARDADEAVFAGVDLPDDRVAAAWAAADAAVGLVAKGAGGLRRRLAAYRYRRRPRAARPPRRPDRRARPASAPAEA